MKFSVIIPVYNEEKTVKQIIDIVKKVPYPGETEIIVVNDGSRDKSAEIIKKIPEIIFKNLKVNHGKGFALRVGIKKAAGQIILIQDADLEYNPLDHLKLIKAFADKKVDVVYGSRFLKNHPAIRYPLFYLGNIALSFLTKVLYQKSITDMETCYKAFRVEVLRNITLKSNRFEFEPEITCKLLKNGYDIKEIPISYKSRSYKEGKKIGLIDGLKAIYVLFRLRFVSEL